MNIVVDGYDGSGKTTLSNALSSFLTEIGVSNQTVGRRLATSNGYVDAMTNSIVTSDGGRDGLSSKADLFLRIARTYERINLAKAHPTTVTIFDRLVPYDLSMVTPEFRTPPVLETFREVMEELGPCLIVHLTGSFDVMWRRVERRAEEDRSPKELLGYDHNFAKFTALEQVLQQNPLFTDVLRIDCEASVQETVVRIAKHLRLDQAYSSLSTDERK